MPVNFHNTYDLAKIFMVKNLGFIKEAGKKTGPTRHLADFVQGGPHDIHNYPSNYKPLNATKGSNITAGNKTLSFIQL